MAIATKKTSQEQLAGEQAVEKARRRAGSSSSSEGFAPPRKGVMLAPVSTVDKEEIEALEKKMAENLK